MKKLLLLLLPFLSGTANAQIPEFLFANRAGGSSYEYGTSCATDASGNIIVVGTFSSSSITIGSTTLTNAGSSSTSDVFVVKYDPNGNVLWVRGAGGLSSDFITGCTTDPSGNIIVTGYFESSSITFGSINLTLSTQGNQRVFTVKYGPNGNVIWAKRSSDIYGNPVFGTAYSSGRSNGCSTDADGNVFITGEFARFHIQFGSELLSLSDYNYKQVFVVKYSPDGDVLWARSAGSSAHDYAMSCSTDTSGNVIITGEYSAGFTFGTTYLSTYTGFNIFLAKFDPDGNVLWAKRAGGNTSDDVRSTSTDVSGNVFITGTFKDSITFDSITLDNVDPGNDTSDVFVAKYDPDGNILWARSAGGTNHDYAMDCTTDTSGNIIITGYFQSPSIPFGSTTLINSGTSDILLVKYDPDGNLIWAESAGAPSNEYGYGCSTDLNNNIIVTGYFRSPSLTFGSTTLTNANTGGNSSDMFVTKLHELLAVAATDVQSACDSYLWMDGNTYTASNNTATYVIEGVAANGWDSIISLDLTVYNAALGVDMQSICDNSFTWIDGNTYTENNNTATYTYAGGAANGCDSIVTLDLTINVSSTGIDMHSVCDAGFTWIDGNTYFASNTTAMHTIVGGAANGCDSIVTLDLTINLSSTVTNVITECESYQWIDGNTYTASTNGATYTIEGGAVNGCDSILSLYLTILPVATGIDVQEACLSYTWINGNTYTSNNSTATYTYANGAANGCDSIVTLNLTVTTVNTGVSVVAPTLTASVTGALYQWLDCNDNYAEIEGATQRSFTATENGDFAVSVTKNGCTDTSNCFEITSIGIEQIVGNRFIVYPNPASNVVYVEGLSGIIKELTLLDITGRQTLYSQKNIDRTSMDISALANGLYIIHLIGEDDHSSYVRLVKGD